MSSNNLNMNEFLDAIDASTATEHHTTAPTTTPAPTTNLTADPTSAPAPVPSDSKYYSTARMVALARPTTVDAAMEAASETVSITNRSFPTFTTYDMDGDIHMTAALNPVPMDSTTDHHPQVAAVYRSHGRGGRKGNHKSSQANKQPIKRPSRQYCIDHGLCFYCYKPLHRYSDCPNRKASSPK
ncbi:hypothetical protein RI543_002647 [Arxiozyma heterogenica]|uniref:CCHC-type domain-containing protein n=1 Tax=Arxiozyma heterogenica TaxID=278026 RepID=A0AAN8A8W5_9SACH|nr:hypothetical protein RI543_002647 [Kazachstania heterogenica]